MPPSASINPAVKPGTPGAPNRPLPANVAPEALPKANALPVPGAKGAPPVPPGAAGPVPGAVNPNARLTPGTTPPAASAPSVPGAAARSENSGEGIPSLERAEGWRLGAEPGRSRIGQEAGYSSASAPQAGYCGLKAHSAKAGNAPGSAAATAGAAGGEACAPTASPSATAAAGSPGRASGSPAATSPTPATGTAAAGSGQEMPGE